MKPSAYKYFHRLKYYTFNLLDNDMASRENFAYHQGCREAKSW